MKMSGVMPKKYTPQPSPRIPGPKRNPTPYTRKEEKKSEEPKVILKRNPPESEIIYKAPGYDEIPEDEEIGESSATTLEFESPK